MFFWKNVNVQKTLTIIGNTIALIIAVVIFITIYKSGTQVVKAGNWTAPFGIVFVGDMFSATLILLTAISGFAVSIFSIASVIKARLRFGFLSVYHFLLLGLNGAFLTGDVFNLYVWFEIIIISSFVLISIGGEKNQLEGAVKYFTLNFFGSLIFLTALGTIYGLTGTLNMADIAIKAAQVDNRVLIDICAVLFLTAFGIKSAMFPLNFWLPASYHTPPSAVSAIFSGLLTKVGVYALIRMLTLIFAADEFLQQLLIILAVLTILSGSFGAIIQNNIRKVFSYLIICHIGFMIGCLGVFNVVAISGVIFYLIHDIIVKTNIFLIGGLIYRIKSTTNMKKIGGLYKERPLTSLLFIIVLFSLVGVPPLSGFWPKLSLFLSSYESENYAFFGALILGSLITLMVVAKIWSEAFWKDQPEMKVKRRFVFFDTLSPLKKWQFITPIVLLAVISLYIGFGAEHIQVLSVKIADDLMNSQNYIDAVLNQN
jgi:multicomponent Na+:H+ antiporter subunit D